MLVKTSSISHLSKSVWLLSRNKDNKFRSTSEGGVSPVHCARYKLVQALWNQHVNLPKKLKVKHLYDSDKILDIYSKNSICTEILNIHVIADLLTVSLK